MKKTYITPYIHTIQLSPLSLLADSLPRGSQEIVSQDEFLVKEQARPSYNVWNDDWSN